jgi:hypothetical protein
VTAADIKSFAARFDPQPNFKVGDIMNLGRLQ